MKKQKRQTRHNGIALFFSPRLAALALILLIVIASLAVFLVHQHNDSKSNIAPVGKATPSAGHSTPTVVQPTPTVGQPTPQPTPVARGKTYYVSRQGNNGDGLSWKTAWDELDQVNWSRIQPGDTILLDGGATSMVYTSSLVVGKSGTASAPITIKRATETGRSGQVDIFGGRTTPLPYCGQRDYTFQTAGVTDTGITIGEQAWIVVDGVSWDGIAIYGHDFTGIALGSSASNDTIRNVEIYDNGQAHQEGDGSWEPDKYGVKLYGSHLTFENMNIYDNGTDAFQSGGISDITIRHSWLHITRENPTKAPGTAFNACGHQDGIQIWGGGMQSGVVIEDSVLGPGLTQGTILGQTPGGGSQLAVVNDVTIRNTLFIDAAGTNIMGYPKIKERDWTIDHVTIYGENIDLWIEGSGHVVENSIFYGGQILLPDGLASSHGNCQWHTTKDTSSLLGQTTDPLFMTNLAAFPTYPDYPPLAQLATINLALAANSPCSGVGSSITSVAQLITSANSQQT